MCLKILAETTAMSFCCPTNVTAAWLAAANQSGNNAA